MFDSDREDSDEQTDNHSANGVCATGAETLSSEQSKSEVKTRKVSSKKNYEPICDGDVYVKYEDNPIEYKRLRKYLNCNAGKSKTERVLRVSEAVRKGHCKVWRCKLSN